MEIRFDVTGMTCAACSARVEKVTRQVPGVENAEVNLLSGSMVVTTQNVACTQEIISSIRKAGRDIQHYAHSITPVPIQYVY